MNRIMARLTGASMALVLLGAACQPSPPPAQTHTAEQVRNADAVYAVEEKTIAALQQDMTAGTITAARLVDLYRQRVRDIDQGGPALHAVISLNPSAGADAARLDQERAAGRVRGPLHGIPVLLKDNIESLDPLATTAGSLALTENITGRDAAIVVRLREAGVVVLGKANLSEWANFRALRSTSGWSAVGGLTRNPYALDRNASGSSSGSAVAVAANLVAAAIGTETDGSITMPAATNGIVGLKPTVGLLSRAGIVPISAAQDTAGPMTRSVADAAALLTVMAGHDGRDAATAEADARKRDYTAALSAQALQGKRLGVMRFLMGYLPALDTLFRDSLAQLQAAGATIVEIPTFEGLDRLGADEFSLMKSDFRDALNAYLAAAPAAVPVRSLQDLIAFNRAQAAREMPFFGQDLLEAAEQTAGHDRAASERMRARIRRGAGIDGIDRLLRDYHVDALIAPATHPAPPSDLINGDHTLGGAPQLPAIAGYPHLAVPMGEIQGLPVGLSFIGAAWSDADLLAMGFAYEQRTRARRPPTYPASIAASAPHP